VADREPLARHRAYPQGDEAFRVLRSNLLGALGDARHVVVVVTSPSEGEGKTSVVAGLAQVLARGGRRVVAVDLDLRRSSLHAWFGTEAAPGAVEVIEGTERLADCLRYVRAEPGGPGLYLLPAGTPPRDPAELLGSVRARAVLDALAAQADLVLVDTAPVLPVADTLALAAAATGVALVVQARRTTIPSALKAKTALVRHRARLLGLVIHRLDPRDAALDTGAAYAGLDAGTGHAASEPPLPTASPGGSARRRERLGAASADAALGPARDPRPEPIPAPTPPGRRVRRRTAPPGEPLVAPPVDAPDSPPARRGARRVPTRARSTT
jgi:capsular exopolysaccharide synthesis family protein